jgi:hypothetical protein
MPVRHCAQGDVRFMLCTDVAARGLDVKELPYVINMTLPDRSEDYIHRVGRVGRADIMGLAVSIVAETELEKVSGVAQSGKQLCCRPGTAVKLLWLAVNPAWAGCKFDEPGPEQPYIAYPTGRAPADTTKSFPTARFRCSVDRIGAPSE